MRRTGVLPGLSRAAWIVLAGEALQAVGSGLTAPFLVVYLHQVCGMGLAPAGLALATIAVAGAVGKPPGSPLAAISVAGLVGTPLGGWLADRLTPRTTMIAASVAAAAGSLGLAEV